MCGVGLGWETAFLDRWFCCWWFASLGVLLFGVAERLLCVVLDLAGRRLSWTGGSAAGGLLLLGSFCVAVSGFYVWCWTWLGDGFLGPVVVLLVVCFSWGPFVWRG